MPRAVRVGRNPDSARPRPTGRALGRTHRLDQSPLALDADSPGCTDSGGPALGPTWARLGPALGMIWARHGPDMGPPRSVPGSAIAVGASAALETNSTVRWVANALDGAGDGRRVSPFRKRHDTVFGGADPAAGDAALAERIIQLEDDPRHLTRPESPGLRYMVLVDAPERSREFAGFDCEGGGGGHPRRVPGPPLDDSRHHLRPGRGPPDRPLFGAVVGSACPAPAAAAVFPRGTLSSPRKRGPRDMLREVPAFEGMTATPRRVRILRTACCRAPPM